jgi:Ca-activated chloride channel family protein
MDNLMPEGINRVVLCTDGDFNVGVTSQSELIDLIQEKAQGGVALSVLGFGTGNYQDSTMEKLADKGNGNYAYVDTLLEARKALVEQMTGTLITIAKDVKIQADFNPSRVQAYRLIGYENRMLRAEDFRDDRKDAGEIGAGHTVTALYEIVPPGVKIELPAVDPSKYVTPGESGGDSSDLLTVRLRYKLPNDETSTGFDVAVSDTPKTFAEASLDTQFAAAVAAFGMLLRDSQYKGGANFDLVDRIARASVGTDANGYRHAFISLIAVARSLASPPSSQSGEL